MSNVESFYWNKLSNKSCSFESEQFFICVLLQQFRGVALITFSIKHCCIVGQEEFSRKTEDSKIKYFLWNEFSSVNSCSELKQFLLAFFCFSLQGVL